MVKSASQVSVQIEARRTGPGVAHQINHVHREIEFNLVASGRGTYFLEDGQYDLVPGTLVWLFPGQAHRLIRSPDFDMWVVTGAADAFEPAMLADLAAQPCHVLSTADAVALDRLLSHLSQDADEPRLYRSGVDYALRSAWNVTVSGDGPVRRPMHPAVVRALAILRSSAETPTSAEMARRCGVAQEYLGKLMVAHTGRGFVEWRNRTRLERFHIVYPNSGDLLTAALEAGFGSYTQFHRVFQEMVGTTPGEWARRGASADALPLPSSVVPITGTDAQSTRMSWYALSEAPLPAAARRLAPGFAHAFAHTLPPLAETAPVASGVTSYADLRAYEPELVEQLRACDAPAAAILARALVREDVFASFAGTFGLYPIDPANLCDIIATFIVATTAAATRAPGMVAADLRVLAARTRAALTRDGIFATATASERALVTANLVAHMVFLRGAVVAARGAGSDAATLRVAAAARASACSTLGLDPLAHAFGARPTSAAVEAVAARCNG